MNSSAKFRPRREVQREYDYSPYFAKTLRFESHIEEAFVTRIYRPLNRGILLTPFHNMALCCPSHTEADVDRHTEVFEAEVIALLG